MMSFLEFILVGIISCLFKVYVFDTYILKNTSIIITTIKSKFVKNDTDTEDIIIAKINADNTRFDDPNDYYAVLKVTKKSTPAEISKSYLDCIAFYEMPRIIDLCNNKLSIDVKKCLSYLNKAYEVLSDKTKKYYYDNNDTIQNVKNPDDMINIFLDGFVSDFDPNDKNSFWGNQNIKKIK